MILTALLAFLPLLASPAQAESVSSRDIAAMVREAAPRVEALLQREYQSLPQIYLTDSPRVLERQRAHWEAILARAQADGLPDAGIRDQMALDLGKIEHSLMVYEPAHHQISVQGDVIEKVFKDVEIAGHLLPDTIYCALTHELAHALQFQHGVGQPASNGSGARLAHLSVLEGQAQWVADTLCLEDRRVAALGLMRGLQNTDGLAAVGAPTAVQVAYGFGQLYFEQKVKEQGTDAAWNLLVDAPTSPREIITPVRLNLPRIWSPDAVAVVGATLADPGFTTTHRGYASLLHILPAAGDLGFIALRSSTESWGWMGQGETTPGREETVFVAAVRLATPGLASKLVSARRFEAKLETSQRKTTHQGWTYMYQGTTRDLAPVSRHLDVDDALHFGLVSSGAQRIDEFWVARGDRLVVVKIQGRKPTRKAAAKVIIALLSSPRVDAPPTPRESASERGGPTGD